MVILVDMDDTIEYLLDAWLEKANAVYGRSVTREEITSWDVSAAYPGLTRQQIYDLVLEDEFWKNVRPIPGAAEALKRFMERGHYVYLVTATPYESVRGKMDYHLFRHFPFIEWHQVIITSHKQMLKADILIDDGIHNLEGGDYAKILVDAPYNRAYDAEANGMIRVHSWAEIEEAVMRIEQEHNRESNGGKQPCN